MSEIIPVNLEFCVEAMRGSMMLRGQALQTELAVSFIVFDACGAADIGAKKILRAVYASAGRVECLTSGSPSYQTINRHMDRSARLYEKVKARSVTKWIKGRSGPEAIDAIIAALEPLHLMSMDDVAEYATGKPRVSARTKYTPENHPKRRSDDSGFAFVVETEHIHVGIPADATPDEVVDAANRLMELAKEMKKKAA